MKRLSFACGALLLALGCGPGSTSHGSGGASTTGGADGANATGGTSSGGATAGDGGANPSGGTSTGGANGATGGQHGSTGGGGSVEPGSALDRFLAAGEPRIVYLQNILGPSEDLRGFYNPQMRSADVPCDRTFVGACALSVGCSVPDEIPRLDAGTITLESAGAAEPLVADLADGKYRTFGGGFFDPVLAGGETLILSAAGGADVPAFELETTFPLVVIIDSPGGDLTAPIPVPTTADLTLEFRRASGNVVLFVEGGVGTGDASRAILCIGAGDPGTMVVPAEALAHIGPGVELTLFTTAIESVEAGDRTVNFLMLTGTSNDERDLLYKLVTQ